MKKFLLPLFTTLLLFPSKVLAQGSFTLNDKGLGVPKLSSAEGSIQTIILNVISLFFAIGGIGVIIYFIWGAVDWIMSGGDKEKVAAARRKMTNAVIGLILLSLSFAIIRTVGAIAGFDPLGNLQIRGLGNPDF